MILAIDTSTEQAGVALSADTGPIAELLWMAGRDHSTQLFEAMQSVLGLGKISVDSLTGIAVASGPGSFSGIRVGLSAGKALALGLHIPLVGINTLDIIAAGACSAARVWATLPAGRGQVFLALYGPPEDRSQVGRRRSSEYLLVTPEEVASFLQWGDHIAGDIGPLQASLDAGTDASLTFDGIAGRMRRASLLAELGKMYFARGGDDQLHEAEPLYLRRSAAEEKRDAAQG
jgi:tRNA threonylcarbamoyladenosine biosynthesis protein TsaB